MKIILILELNVMKSVHLLNFTELGLRQCLTLRPATRDNIPGCFCVMTPMEIIFPSKFKWSFETLICANVTVFWPENVARLSPQVLRVPMQLYIVLFMSFWRILSTLWSQAAFHNLPHFSKERDIMLRKPLFIPLRRFYTVLFIPLF